MTFVDDSHVRMIKPDGDMMLVDLSEQGMMAYVAETGLMPLASK